VSVISVVVGEPLIVPDTVAVYVDDGEPGVSVIVALWMTTWFSVLLVRLNGSA